MTESPPAWYVPLGQTLTEAHALALRDTFGDEVIRLGRAYMDRVRQQVPGSEPEGKLVSVVQLLHAYQHPRSEKPDGITLATVFWFDGFWKVVGFGIKWHEGKARQLGKDWLE